MSNESTALVEFIAAIVAGDTGAVRLVRATPAIAQERIVAERFAAEVPHRLYAGESAGNEQQEIVALLLEHGGDPRAKEPKGNRPRI